MGKTATLAQFLCNWRARGPVAVYVAGCAAVELLLRTLLESLDAHVRGDVDLSGLSMQGGLSQWITEMYREPLRKISAAKWEASKDKLLLITPLMQAFGFSQGDAKALSDFATQARRMISIEDAQRMLEARSQGEEMKYLLTALEIGRKATTILGLKPPVSGGDFKTIMTNYARIMRVHRMAARCFAFLQTHPLTLIASAREGNKRAVLDLIKIDKMFLRDSCTEKVIKEAELRGDQNFLRQLARAQQYIPKPRRTTRYRLALYCFFAIAKGSSVLGGEDIKLPNSAKLHLLLDPEGKDFRTNEALERFVERCHREWEKITTTALADFMREEGIVGTSA